MDREASQLRVHVYSASPDSRLRIKWEPASDETPDGQAGPREEAVHFDRVLTAVEVHSGVLQHGAARRLDTAGWRLDGGVVRSGAVDVAALRPSCDQWPCACGAVSAADLVLVLVRGVQPSGLR